MLLPTFLLFFALCGGNSFSFVRHEIVCLFSVLSLSPCHIRVKKTAIVMLHDSKFLSNVSDLVLFFPIVVFLALLTHGHSKDGIYIFTGFLVCRVISRQEEKLLLILLHARFLSNISDRSRLLVLFAMV